jgi:hypothetical protein
MGGHDVSGSKLSLFTETYIHVESAICLVTQFVGLYSEVFAFRDIIPEYNFPLEQKNYFLY